MDCPDLACGGTPGWGAGVRLIRDPVSGRRLVLPSKLWFGALLLPSQFSFNCFTTGRVSSSHGVLKPFGASVIEAPIELELDVAGRSS